MITCTNVAQWFAPECTLTKGSCVAYVHVCMYDVEYYKLFSLQVISTVSIEMSEEPERPTCLVNEAFNEDEGEAERAGEEVEVGTEVVEREEKSEGEERDDKHEMEDSVDDGMEDSVFMGEGKDEEREDGGRREEERFSDVNLATPQNDLPSLEFFDHNVTSSDSSGACRACVCTCLTHCAHWPGPL